MHMNRRQWLGASAAFTLFPACAMSRSLDTAYINARIWSAGMNGTQPGAIGVIRNTIAAIGSEAVQAGIGKRTRLIDLNGAFVMPGFIDTHTHFLLGSRTLFQPKLREASTQDEFIKRIGEAAQTLKPGQWMQGGGWDHQEWGGELPSRHWIDPVTPETPVAVARSDLHMLLLNTLALKLAGIDRNTPDVPGGVIMRDENGDPTGVIKDEAKKLVERAIPAPTDSENEQTMAAGAEYAMSKGVTQAHITAINWDDHNTLRRTRAKGKTGIRFYSFTPLEDWKEIADLVREEGRGDDWLRWGGVKALVDGSLGSRTARFYQGYSDMPSEHGIFVNNEANLRSWIGAADAEELHVTTHAIGDEANDLLLDIYADVVAANGPRDRRFRIEHAQHLTSEAIKRIAQQNVIASVQPYHAIDDGRWAVSRIGEERLQGTYAFKSLMDAGAHVSFGSDWPVAPIDPMKGVVAAVLRQTLDGANSEGWLPEQKLSLEKTLYAYTAANAYAGFQEDRLGALEVGKLADFIVLDQDPFAVDPEKVSGTEVLRTVIDGEQVYGGDAPS